MTRRAGIRDVGAGLAREVAGEFGPRVYPDVETLNTIVDPVASARRLVMVRGSGYAIAAEETATACDHCRPAVERTRTAVGTTLAGSAADARSCRRRSR